jgi:hypothetical protein
VGTIGPYLAGEPLHMVLGRQFMATAGQGNFFTPTGGINFFPAWVDADGGQIYLDLGNALSTATPGGPNNDLGDLVLGIYDPIATPSAPAGTVVSLGVVRSQGPVGYASYPQWYARTAGVVALPLSPGQLAAVQTRPLVLGDPATAGIAEWSNGLFARADTYVYRMSPGDQAEVTVYATQYGQPLANTSIGFTFDHQQLQPGGGYPYIGDGPSVATPDGVLTFDAAASTGPDGKAVLTVTAGDPGTPRWFNGGADYGIDGQVYGVRPGFADPSLTSGPVNQWNFVSFLAWSGYTPPSTVTWTDLQPIFQQYANLYPVMLRFLNLGDYESVKAHAGLLTLAFGLDIGDPNTMPVTRDLSPAKRQAILGWLSNPIYGEVAPPALRAALPPGADSPPDPAGGPPTAMRGGKAAAAARRLILQTR